MSDTVRLGSGRFEYEVAVGWEKPPAGVGWREVAGVITDEDDNVYAFSRGDNPVVVFDKDGEFLRTWGEGLFTRAHGISRGPNGTFYCADDGDHTIRQCAPDGEVLMTIGIPGEPAPMFSGAPFNRCTHVATDPENGDLFISDGYGNSRVHKYSADGERILSWGSPGVDPGQFNIAHNIATDRDGFVYVCDRENHRIQVFDRDGGLEDIWTNVHRPCAIYIDGDERVYVGELGWGMSVNREMPNIGPRVSIMTPAGKVLERLGNGWGLETGQFISPHGIAVDSRKNIYVAEVAHTNISHTATPPEGVRAFQKLTAVGTQSGG